MVAEIGLNIETISFLNNATAMMTPIAQHTYEVYVRQAMIEGIIASVVGLFGLIMACVFSYDVWKSYSKKKHICDGAVTLLFVGVMLFIIGFFIGTPHLINPEYYAIEKLLASLG